MSFYNNRFVSTIKDYFMSDVHSKKTRSYNMSQIKAKDTKPEMIVRRFLHSKGLRYSLHSKKLPGKPDIYFPKYKTVVEIYGCFWHGHDNCKYYALPKTKQEWWQDKISKTKERDIKNKVLLEKMELKVILVWECSLKNKNHEAILEKLYNEIIE